MIESDGVDGLEQAQVIFEGLLLSVAQWTIRFGADRMAAKKV